MTVAVLPFSELGTLTAHALWRLRQDVFVVEQRCAYPDLDGRDVEPGTRHVLLTAPGGELLGCARVLDDAPAWRIGRVALAAHARGRGLADRLIAAALDDCARRDATRDVVLNAQTPLAPWYATFGFAVDGPEYPEDGIRHLPMRRRR